MEKPLKQGYVYILSNFTNTVLYVGVTSNLPKRICEHKNKLVEGFTCKYNVDKLVYYETTNDMYTAISREKQIKGGSRKKKNDLIEAVNPDWKDLYEDILK
jgi:putative endonuclease